MMAVSLKNPTNKMTQLLTNSQASEITLLMQIEPLGKKLQATRRQHVEYFAKDGGIVANMDAVTFEPRHEKTGFLHMRKQSRRSAAQ